MTEEIIDNTLYVNVSGTDEELIARLEEIWSKPEGILADRESSLALARLNAQALADELNWRGHSVSVKIGGVLLIDNTVDPNDRGYGIDIS